MTKEYGKSIIALAPFLLFQACCLQRTGRTNLYGQRVMVRSRNHGGAEFNSQQFKDSCRTVQRDAVVFVAFITRNLGFIDTQFLGKLSLRQASSIRAEIKSCPRPEGSRSRRTPAL